MIEDDQKPIGQTGDAQGRYFCVRCHKKMAPANFYTYRDGSKCELCKPCLTAHIDNFDPSTFEWILKKLDVPYLPNEWNILRDRAFVKDPQKMNGMSVIGRYVAKMKLRQFRNYTYADSEKLQKQMEAKENAAQEKSEEEKEKFEADLKEKLDNGEISQTEYITLVRAETIQKDTSYDDLGDKITGERKNLKSKQPSSYEEALSQYKNPFREQNFLRESKIPDPAADLTEEDKIYLALKWGRLYTPSQWVSLEQMYNEFMDSFDIQGAARVDTLKMICKTSLKMNQAIDCGDIDTYQKLSRVYDSMMKSAKFTEAQNKEAEINTYDSASAIVDFVQAHSGQIPRYKCKEPQDIVDQIIFDLKNYTKNLIYEDKSLAREIEKYLQDKKIMDEMRRDKEEAKKKNGLDPVVELEDSDYIKHKENIKRMREHDQGLTDEKVEQEYLNRRIIKAK